MINEVDEKVDNLALAVRESFQALGTDTTKLAVQVIAIYRLLIDHGLTNEEDFKKLFLETAADMQAQSAPVPVEDDLADIKV